MEKEKQISLLIAMLLLSVPSLTAFAQDSDEEESGHEGVSAEKHPEMEISRMYDRI
jgi:hypothetical protein